MKKLLVLLFLFPVYLQAGIVQIPYIEREPALDDYSDRCAYMYPAGQPEKVYAPDELDVRSCDISSWNLTNYSAQELADVITFDTQTTFPSRANLPVGFMPYRLLRINKNPGLRVERIHEKGIQGQGVSVAIIDQNILTNHREYERNLKWYEEDPYWNDKPASMHGTAAASLLVGNSIGIAPRARLFYFAAAMKYKDGFLDAMPIADNLQKIIALNSKLPPSIKIRVIAILRGFDPQDNGYEAFTAAKNRLEKEGVAVFTTDDVYTLSRIHGADNPNVEPFYCRPAYWLEPKEYQKIYDLSNDNQDLLIPTDYHTAAAPTDTADYAFYATGGLTWGVTYVAGLYALGVQIDPSLTKDKFLQAWDESATEMNCLYSDTSFTAHRFVRPVALAQKLAEESPLKEEHIRREKTWKRERRQFIPRTAKRNYGGLMSSEQPSYRPPKTLPQSQKMQPPAAIKK